MSPAAEDEEVVLDAPGLPALAHLALLWEGGRTMGVDFDVSAFAGMPDHDPRNLEVLKREFEHDS